jgi:hypothetical protein
MSHGCFLVVYWVLTGSMLLIHALDEDVHRSAYFARVDQCSATDLDTSDIIQETSLVSDTHCTLGCLANDQCLVVDYCQIGDVATCFQRTNQSYAPCSPGIGCERWELKVRSTLKLHYPL